MEEILKKMGSWLFLIGILVAVIIGIVYAANETWLNNYTTYISAFLAILGFIVGIMSFFAIGNITRDRVPTFLIAALLLLGIGATSTLFNNLQVVGPYFSWIAVMLAIFIAPAAGLLAIRAIWDAGKTEEIENIMPKIPL